MKRIAIIGASLFQAPLIIKAKNLGYETHVFAWKANDVGESLADFFYPISIKEKELILQKCLEIGVDAVCSIGSDIATITVNYIGNKLGMNCNSLDCSYLSTNKHLMRKAFEEHGVPSPRSILVSDVSDLDEIELTFPMIVKPTDRSGSRGINKVYDRSELKDAIEKAKEESFEKMALVEDFVEGQEYSIECISYHGEHHLLAITKKYTTGAPHFVERGHFEPAPEEHFTTEEIRKVVFSALDALQIHDSASHTELKVAEDGTIKLIEVGARMGGDFIGSHLVELSTGIDYVKAVIDVALDNPPDIEVKKHHASAVVFIFDEADMKKYKKVCDEHPEYISLAHVEDLIDQEVFDSTDRKGYFVVGGEKQEYIYSLLDEKG